MGLRGMGANNFRIEHSESVLQSLCYKNIIVENNQPHWGNVNANLSRALGWLTKCDCVILTAWRSGKLRKENDDNNRELQLKIRSYGYGVSKVRGCYTEIGKPTTRENSFLVFAKELGDKLFYDRIFELSAHYEQDCFLYKPAGRMETAYLIGTNEDFISQYGRKKVAGKLRIATMEANEYSRIGSGKICFDN